MKILCVIGSIGVGGGAERVLSNLCNYFSKKHDVVYLALDEYKGDKYYLEPRVKLYNGLNYKNSLHAVICLRKTIRKEKPDVVLSFLTQINIAVLLATLFTRIPVVVSDRGNLGVKNFLYKYLRLFLYPKAAGIVLQTQDARNYFEGPIHEKAIVIHNPVFVNEFSQGIIGQRRKEIVTVGRLEFQKNHELLIHAFSSISNKIPEYKLLIYGGGTQEASLKALVASLKMDEKIIFCGRIPDVHKRICNASLFVMSSRWEGMPNALMEAMALGLPCISTDCPVGGPRELIKDGENGFLINNFDQKALEDKILKVLPNTELLERVGNNASKITESHSIDVICKKWEDYLLSRVSKYND